MDFRNGCLKEGWVCHVIEDLAFGTQVVSHTSAEEIAAAVWEICDGYHRGCRRYTGLDIRKMGIDDRRGSGREAISLPFYLTPVPSTSRAEAHASDVIEIAVTRDLSERGVGFRCDVPLHQPLQIAEFDILRTGSIRLLLEVCWHRRESAHSYLAGGRFLRILRPHELR